MATTTEELNNLIETARKNGAKVLVKYDEHILKTQGRMIIDAIKVSAPGVGPYAMSPIAAAETLRKWNSSHV